MASRLKLHEELKTILGSNNVYYQPPGSVNMSYPAILYSRSNIKKRNADNTAYILTNSYDITVIDYKPDNPAIDKLAALSQCTFDRTFVADNLYHTVFTLYY